MAVTTDYRSALSALVAGRHAADLETRTLDWKRETSDRREMGQILAEAAVCFANAVGGTIVVGVDDRGSGPSALVGATLSTDEIRQLIHQRTEPPMTLEVREERIQGVRLAIIVVPEGLEVYTDSQRRAFRRRDSQTCDAMPPVEVARLREERSGFDWSEVASDRSVSDVSPLAVAGARSRLAALTDERARLARASDQDILRALGLITPEGRLRRAGEILFCNPAAGQPSIVYDYRPTPGGEVTASERLSAPLLLAFQRSLELVDARRNETPVNLPDGQQIHVADFPSLAVREAIANAVLHRDYRLLGPVTIDHSRSVLVVDSPGPLVAGVTSDNILTHPSKPRNPTLASAFRTLGLAEEIGRGVDRIYREMIRAGRELPRIDDEGDRVRLSLVGGNPNTRIARFVAQLPEDERDDTDTMLLVFTLCGRQTVSAPVVASILQKSPEEAEVVLRRLATDPPGILEATRGTLRRSHPSYRLRGSALELLGPAVKYQRRSVDEIDRKVIQHVREYSRITNKTMRNMLDIDVQRAKQILIDLVARQVLVKTSPQQRGPNIEYGAGPQFPPRSPRSRRSISEKGDPSGVSSLDDRSEQLRLDLPVGPKRRRLR